MSEYDDQHNDGDQAGDETTAIGGMTAGELYDTQLQEARDRLDQLASETTQREWLIITRKLDRTRAQIGADSGLTMLALAWVQAKHEHGGANFDKLLDATDSELEKLLGFPEGSRPEE